MLEHLWNGWRSTYVTSGGAAGGVGTDDVASGRGSVFTRILHSGLPDVDTHIVHRGTHVFAILNAFPYAVGHILVIPYREVGELEELTPEEAAEVWRTVTDAVVADLAAADALRTGVRATDDGDRTRSVDARLAVLEDESSAAAQMTQDMAK